MAHKFPIALKKELDSPQRRRLFGPIKALRSLGIRKHITVADVGCGTGFFTIPLVRIVGLKGMVFAVDISCEMLNEVKKRIRKNKLKNVKVLFSKENKIPIGSGKVDYCLLSSVVHELENKTSFFKELKRILKERGRIGIIEWKKIRSPLGPPLEERIPLSVIKQDIIKSGFDIKNVLSLGRYNCGIIAAKFEKEKDRCCAN